MKYRNPLLLCLLALFWLAACSSAPGKAASSPEDEVILLSDDNLLLAEGEIPEEDEELMEFPPPSGDLPVSSFGETWAYMLAGREDTLRRDMPLSDIVIHSADVDSYGKLRGVPNPKTPPPALADASTWT